MATRNGSNYIKSITPNSVIDSGDNGGKLKCVYDTITLIAGEGLIADEIKVCTKLPQGARVHDAIISSSSHGAAGTLSLGLEATLDSTGAILAKDINSLVDSAAAIGAAFTKKASDSANLAGLLVKLGQATQPILTFDIGSTTPAGVVIKVAIYYTLD
jgi:hypothetical protein